MGPAGERKDRGADRYEVLKRSRTNMRTVTREVDGEEIKLKEASRTRRLKGRREAVFMMFTSVAPRVSPHSVDGKEATRYDINRRAKRSATMRGCSLRLAMETAKAGAMPELIRQTRIVIPKTGQMEGSSDGPSLPGGSHRGTVPGLDAEVRSTTPVRGPQLHAYGYASEVAVCGAIQRKTPCVWGSFACCSKRGLPWGESESIGSLVSR